MDDSSISLRDRQLAQLLVSADTKQNFPLLKEISPVAAHVRLLQDSIGQYLKDSLWAAGIEPMFDNCEEMVRNQIEAFLSLPNITPNGVLRPKLETYLSFNNVHRCLVDLFRDLGLPTQISKMRIPLSVRVLGGQPAKWAESRPRSCSKLHSDFWIGSCCDFSVHCHIFGDTQKTAWQFFEPIGIKEDFLSELPNYDSGLELFDDLKRYDLRINTGSFLFQDIYCLRQLARTGGGPAVYLDWTGQSLNYSSIAARYSKTATQSDNHFAIADWLAFGRRFLYLDSESFAECQANLAEHSRETELRAGAAIVSQTAGSARIVDVLETSPARNLAKFASAAEPD